MGDKVAAVVAIDEETGGVTVKEVWDVHDCGTVINPSLLHAQVHGTHLMGMGVGQGATNPTMGCFANAICDEAGDRIEGCAPLPEKLVLIASKPPRKS